MSNLQYFTHGSEDSLDHDSYVIFEHVPSFHEAKAFCDSNKELNLNILVLKDGYVDWCFKGTEDECNNSLFLTYGLHKQEHPNPIKSVVTPNLELKIVRTIRGLLSYFSRTELRSVIKEALRSDNFLVKLNALKQCSLSYDVDFKKSTHVEVMKFYAFQLAQTMALIDKGVFLFTKSQCASYYPKLKPYLYREKGADLKDLNVFFNDFISFLETHIFEVEIYKKTKKHPRYVYSHVTSGMKEFDFIEFSKFQLKNK